MTTPTTPVTINAHAGDDLRPVAGDWQVDPTHSTLAFGIRYAMFTTVRGRFTRFSGDVHLDPLALAEVTIDVVIDAASVDTSLAVRDEHVRGEEFFDTDHHPEIRFHSHGTEVLAAGRYVTHGELTIRDITQPVRLETDFFGQAPDIAGNPRLGFRATARVQRSRWGINWNAPVPGGGVLLGDDVDLDLVASLLPRHSGENM